MQQKINKRKKKKKSYVVRKLTIKFCNKHLNFSNNMHLEIFKYL